DPADSFRPIEVFGQGNTFMSQRLVGELDVSQIAVTHTKDALVWDADDEEAFLDQLREVVDSEPLPLIKMANNYRATERSRSVQTTVKSVVDAVARATTDATRRLGTPAPESHAVEG